MRVTVYNPLTASSYWRMAAVLTELRHDAVIGLPGTQKRVAVDAPPYQSHKFNGAGGSFMGISTWSLRVKQKCWCVVALLVSDKGICDVVPRWEKTRSETSVSLFSTCFPSHLEGVKQHLGGRRWMLCTNGLMGCSWILMNYWVGHAPKNHMTSWEQWERNGGRQCHTVSETFYVDSQLLYHKRFIWLHPHFTAGRWLQLIPAAGPRGHMPLTMDLGNGMRHCPDPTDGRWDHEKIKGMLSDPVCKAHFLEGA